MMADTRYPIEHEGREVGEFYLSGIPGCCKVCLSHGLKIKPEFQDQGIGTHAQGQRLKLARELGFKVMMATVVDENKRQETILTRFGWKRSTAYESEKGYKVHVWVKNLCDPYEDAQGQGKGCY